MLDPDPDQREIRLLEVTRSAPGVGEPSAVEFASRPDLGVRFSSAVLLLSPEEWERVQRGLLALPQGWVRARLTAV
ncbi:MAG: hypothetical protein ABI193_13250 [Minicystis sp.]